MESGEGVFPGICSVKCRSEADAVEGSLTTALLLRGCVFCWFLLVGERADSYAHDLTGIIWGLLSAACDRFPRQSGCSGIAEPIHLRPATKLSDYLQLHYSDGETILRCGIWECCEGRFMVELIGLPSDFHM